MAPPLLRPRLLRQSHVVALAVIAALVAALFVALQSVSAAPCAANPNITLDVGTTCEVDHDDLVLRPLLPAAKDRVVDAVRATGGAHVAKFMRLGHGPQTKAATWVLRIQGGEPPCAVPGSKFGAVPVLLEGSHPSPGLGDRAQAVALPKQGGRVDSAIVGKPRQLAQLTSGPRLVEQRDIG